MKFSLLIAIYIHTQSGGMSLHKEYIHAQNMTAKTCVEKMDSIGKATHDIESITLAMYCIQQKE